MATEIRVWQILDGALEPVTASMLDEGRREVDDLQRWIRSHPEILGGDLMIIGEQVLTKGGPVDFLAVDRSGNLVIVELKRDRLPREALAQAIDYGSSVASWDADKVSEICAKYGGQTLQDMLSESFEDIDLEDLVINKVQRILLVGFSIEEPLQRMIEWLSGTYGVSANAVILTYIKTRSGDELIARTMIIPEEVDRERATKGQIQISMSDDPGDYEDNELRARLRSYLAEDRVTPRRMREIVLPLCLDHEIVTRDMIKNELIQRGEAIDEGKAGIVLTTISREIGIEQRDYLRQIIAYDRPNPWEKDHYRLVEKYRPLVSEVLSALHAGSSA
jgi:hypothetical protein